MPGLIRGVARTAVVAGTATAVSNRVSRRHAGRSSAKQQQQYEHEAYQQQQAQQAYQQQQAYAPPPPAAPADDTSDKLEQLKQLGDLKAQGVLSEAEFQAEKNKI